MNDDLKHLMKELGEAINSSLADSDAIADAIAKIKASGYDVFLVLEATIGFNKQGEEAHEEASVRTRSQADFNINAQDVKFLKSLRISVDDAA